MEIIKGVIVDEIESGDYDIVLHGCNCLGIMGGGVARVLNEYTHGWLLDVDRMSVLGDINKLGMYSELLYYTDSNKEVMFYNLYTQFSPMRKGERIAIHWDSYEKSLQGALREYQDIYGDIYNKKILLPVIGCGLAGGLIQHFMEITNEILKNLNYTIVTNESTAYTCMQGNKPFLRDNVKGLFIDDEKDVEYPHGCTGD